MKFTSEAYRQAALEHVAAARELYDADPPRYVLAHYVAGLAVECMLRAYRHRIDPEFDERHDLRALYKAARFDEIVPSSLQEQIGTARSIVNSKERTRRIVEASFEIVNVGNKQWIKSLKS